MKKIYLLSLLISLLASVSLIGQNMMTNGDLELWTDGVPDSWNHVENITQESAIIHGGTYSAKQESASGTKDFGHENITGIVEGIDYDLSYYYLDNDDHARIRLWSKWKDAAGGTIGDAISNDYSVDNADWQVYTITITAPAGATEFYFEVRAYKEDNGDFGGFVYYDDISFEAGGAATAAISNAYSISNTAVEVEYNIEMTSVVASDYSLTGTETITFSNATIDGTNARLVHLTDASVNIEGDVTVDNIADAGNVTDFDFYAGIMPVAFVNTLNPDGTMNNDNIATFQGVVSANDAYNNVWFSDADGAYNGALVYDYDFDDLVAVGDEILFYAIRDVYSNLSELVDPVLISIISSGNSPYGPTVIDGLDIDENITAETNPGEKWEGQLVTINDFVVDSYTDYDYRCSWSDGTTTYYFHIGDNVDYQLGNISIVVGETYSDITGVIDWYGDGSYYRVNPRNQDDVVVDVSSIDNNGIARLTVYPNPASNRISVNSNESGVIKIMSISGKLMIDSKIITGKNSIDIETLSSGLYIVETISNSGIKSIGKLTVR